MTSYSLFRQLLRTQPKKPSKWLKRLPLYLERLEDRTVPAVFNVNTLADTQVVNLSTGQDASGNISLRSALEAANTNGVGNTINLTIGGDYRITTPGANTGTNASGAFVILPSSGGVTINNTSGTFVDVDGAGLDRVFDINPANTSIASTKITVTMSGFTIENGFAQPGDGAPGSGGGIRDQGNTNLTLNNMVVTGNSASADGGGISMENLVSTPWTLNLNNSTISLNRAGDAGGGIEEDGTGHVNITGSNITANTTVNQGAGVWLDAVAAGTVTNPVITSGGTGYTSAPTVTFTAAPVGGTTATGTATILGGVVTSIVITNPGAGYTTTPTITFTGGGGTGAAATTTVVATNQSATLNITTSLINRNVAIAGPGGGVGQAGASTVTITSSTLSGNVAGMTGGGFGDQNGLGTLILLNDTIVHNTAVGEGGGVSTSGPATLIEDTTVTDNASQVSGGGLQVGSTSFTLDNTIVAGNFAGPMNFTGGTAPDVFAAVTATTPASSGNFIGINDGNLTGITNGTNGNQIGTTATPLIALLGPLQNNGGPTPTELPLAGSLVIDKGVNTVVPATDPITGLALTDQRGLTRIVNGTVDVGAVESVPITTAMGSASFSGQVIDVNTIGDTQAVAPTTSPLDASNNISLRSALEYANAKGGGFTINLTVGGDYRITTPGANTGTNASGAFVILPSSGGVTINNTSGTFVDVDGAGLDRVFDINPANTSIASTKITVAMSGFTIENGFAQPGDGAPGSGGGIRDQGNTNLTLNNMVVVSNSATADGGGISMENLVSTPWTLNLNNSTISLNRAGDAGGGIEEDGTGHVNITGSVISANTTVNQGGGIWLDAVAAGTVTNPVITSGGSGYTSAPTVTFVGGGFTTMATGTATINSSGMVTSIIITNPGEGYTSAPTIMFTGGGGTGASATTTVVAANQTATLNITTSLIDANKAINGPGGGVGQAGTSTVTITSSTLSDNFEGADGGGFGDQNNQGTLILVNDTIVDNTAVGHGGGVAENGPATLIEDTTITGNAAQVSAGGAQAGSTSFTLDNTIVAGNFAGPMNFTGGTAPDILATVTATPASSGNFIGINDGSLTGITNGTNGNQIGTTATPLIALLSPLQNNGGPTPTEVPLAGSLVVDKGITAALPATDPITGQALTDQRGFLRVSGAAVDVGADELQPITAPVFTSSASTTFLTTVPGSFSITFTGTPTVTVSESGTLPSGITFNPATDVLSGQALPGTNGSYSITFTAKNSIGSSSQAFTLTINSPVDELGAYRASNGSWSLDSDGTMGFNGTTDQVFYSFSPPGVIGVAGDWTGTGHTNIGDFSNGVWHLDLNGNGVLDAGETFQFGQAGDQPVVGDWTGNGVSNIGVFRTAPDGITGEFILDTNGDHIMDAGDETFTFGLGTDRIVIGDWNGAGKDEVGVFRDAGSYIAADAGDAVFSLDTNGDHVFDNGDQVFIFGLITDHLIVGDWNGGAQTDLGVYRDGSSVPSTSSLYAPGTALFSLDTLGNHMFGPGDAVFLYGLTTDQFVAGHWLKTPPVQPEGTPQAQFAANGQGPGGVAPLTEAELAPVLQQAMAAWEADGANPMILQAAQVQIAPLSDNLVGQTTGNQITLDPTADGWGWNTNSSPAAFTAMGANGLQATPGSAAAGQMDLLTVVEHELGHELGLADVDPTTHPTSLMAATLPVGTRRNI